MNVEQIRQRLRALGARPSHEGRLLRAWLQGRALDGGPHTESNRLPKALQMALPELEAGLLALARVRS
ncbi:MAG: rRNA methyltransferase, partial [Thauera sp.]|nr:rRNA methyltransferase [Thauera sp.]